LTATATADATPRTGTPGWAQLAPPLLGGRFEHITAAVDGQVLVLGGYTGMTDHNQAHGAELYDPASGRWRRLADPPAGHWTWAQVAGNEVYVVSTDEGRVAEYDRAADTWAELPAGPFPDRTMTVASAWTGDHLLVVTQADQDGTGQPVPSFLAGWDPAASAWSDVSQAPGSDQIGGFNTAVWTGHELLIASTPGASGKDYPHLSVVRYAPGEGWSQLPAPPITSPERRGGGYFAWTGIELVVGGGQTWSQAAADLSAQLVSENRQPTAEEQSLLAGDHAADVAAWNPATQQWRTLPDAPSPAFGDSWRYTAVTTDHEVGTWENDPSRNDGMSGRLLLLDPSTGTWRTSDRAPGGERQMTGFAWTGHEIVLVGGEPSDGDADASGCCHPVDGALSFTP
jgi:hypothetical protein